MFAGHSPERENTSGARWNPPGVSAIYASLSVEGALAEAEHQIAMQPVRPRARRTLYELRVTLHSVLNLSERTLLAALGIGQANSARMIFVRARSSALPPIGSNGTASSFPLLAPTRRIS
jgi:RES domain-containing protein